MDADLVFGEGPGERGSVACRFAVEGPGVHGLLVASGDGHDDLEGCAYHGLGGCAVH